jgi:hypothetical protein
MPVDLAMTVPTGLVKILLARRLLFDMVRGNLLQKHSRQFDRSRAAFLFDADSQGAFRLGRSGEGDAVAFSLSTSHVAGQWQHCGCSRWSGRKRKRRDKDKKEDTIRILAKWIKSDMAYARGIFELGQNSWTADGTATEREMKLSLEMSRRALKSVRQQLTPADMYDFSSILKSNKSWKQTDGVLTLTIVRE